MSHPPNEHVRIYTTPDNLCQWPEYRCQICGEWKPAMAYNRVGNLERPARQCRACVSRQERARRKRT
jgi:hypothetical protein